jgi:hypothetical protein
MGGTLKNVSGKAARNENAEAYSFLYVEVGE